MVMVVGATSTEAKSKPELSALAIQQLQSKDFEADKAMTFGAVITVLQDEGYRVQSGDRDTGLITAVGSGKKKLTWAPFVGFGKSKKLPWLPPSSRRSDRTLLACVSIL